MNSPQLPQLVRRHGELLAADRLVVMDGTRHVSNLPTLNVRGLQAAYVGDAVRTIIPAEAVAMIDIRLVPESDGKRLLGLLRDYIQSQGD